MHSWSYTNASKHIFSTLIWLVQLPRFCSFMVFVNNGHGWWHSLPIVGLALHLIEVTWDGPYDSGDCDGVDDEYLQKNNHAEAQSTRSILRPTSWMKLSALLLIPSTARLHAYAPYKTWSIPILHSPRLCSILCLNQSCSRVSTSSSTLNIYHQYHICDENLSPCDVMCSLSYQH